MSLRKKFVNSTLVNKHCGRCKNIYPRDDQHFYKIRHGWDSWCITCRNNSTAKWKENNKTKKKQSAIRYEQSEYGFFNQMFHAMKKSKYYIESEFPDQKSFMNHWYKQKKKLGIICPATGVEMTMIKGKGKATGTNISKDRLLPWEGYTKINTIFVTWKFNNDKKSITPKDAKAYLRLVEERFNTVDIDGS